MVIPQVNQLNLHFLFPTKLFPVGVPTKTKFTWWLLL